MGTRRVEIGSTGEAVQANIKRIRKGQGLTLRALAERLATTAHPMAHNTISDIENGGRRCDVDDLVALAEALGVTPGALLSRDPAPGDLPVTRSEVRNMIAAALAELARTAAASC